MTWANRFQEFVPNWSDPENIEAPIYDLGNISDVPVSMIVSENDQSCYWSEAYNQSLEIKSMANFVTLKEQDHYIYGWYSGPDFTSLMLREITTEVPDQIFREEVTLTFEGLEYFTTQQKIWIGVGSVLVVGGIVVLVWWLVTK